MASLALPHALPSVAAMPGDVQNALPALTVMLANGAVNFLIALLILIAGWAVARWVGRRAHDLIGRSHYIDETLKPLISNFAQYTILALTVVVVLGQFGVQTTSLIALLGAAGLAVGLALQGTLSNVASGVMLLFLRPFRVYDKVQLASATGTVQEIGLFRTAVVTDNGNYVSIPNADIFSGTIVNISREARRRTDFTIEVDRSEDLDALQKTVLEAVARDPRVLKEPAPNVEVTTLAPISTILTVEAWVANDQFGGALSDIKKRVRRALNEKDVTAPVPVPAPSVAPWTPPAERPAGEQAKKPN